MRPDVEQTATNPVPQGPRRDPAMPIHVSLGGRNRATISPTEGLVLSPSPENVDLAGWLVVNTGVAYAQRTDYQRLRRSATFAGPRLGAARRIAAQSGNTQPQAAALRQAGRQCVAGGDPPALGGQSGLAG
jgi:hypothetical protein